MAGSKPLMPPTGAIWIVDHNEVIQRQLPRGYDNVSCTGSDGMDPTAENRA